MRTITFLTLLLWAVPALRAQTLPNGGTAPVLTYIAAGVCGSDLTNQFFLLTVGTASHNFAAAPPQVQSNCSGTGLIGTVGAYNGNSALVSQMNSLVGNCLSPVFLNLMAAPYNGVAPAGAKVLVFVGGNPDLLSMGGANAFAGLCGGGNIYVAFGNYAGGKVLFPNRSNYDPTCGNYISVGVSIGGTPQQFNYDPQRIKNSDGGYVSLDPGGLVRYGDAFACGIPALSCPPPPAVTFSGDLSICEGERTVVTANAPFGYTYLWEGGSNAQSIEVGPEQTADYYVTVTSNLQPQCATSAKATVEVFQFPELSLSAINANLWQASYCYGEAVKLNHALSPAPNQNVALTWYGPDGNALPGGDYIPTINENTAGVYTAKAVYANGCRQEKTLTVAYPAPIPVRVCSNAPLCPNQDLNMEASFQPVQEDPGRYQWTGPDFVGQGSSVVAAPRAGFYSVTVTDAQGCTHTGTTYVAVHLCTDQVGVLGDWVWNDLDRDGIQDAGEPGLAGVTAKCYADADGNGVPDGTALATATTDASGYYHFLDLFPGKYVLEFLKPAGYAISPRGASNGVSDSDIDPTSGRTASLTVAPSSQNNQIDAGFYVPPAQLGDWVWTDNNGNGWQDAGEPGLGGVTVGLYADANADGVPDGAVLAQQVSQSSGFYQFLNVQPGTYLLAFSAPAGWQAALRQNNAPKDAGDSDMDEVSGRTGPIAVVAAEQDGSNDAGFYRPASVGNYVWNDANRNGRQDAGEPGIAGVGVSLFADANADGIPDGPAVASATTGSSGNYTISGLRPGKYVLGFATPPLMSPTLANQGPDDNGDSDPDPSTGRTGTITLLSDQNLTNSDAGFYTPQMFIGDRIWEDLDGNGRQTSGEPGIAGVTVRLYADANADGVPDGPALFATSSNATGNYLFDDSGPGRFVLEFVSPSGYSATLQDQGSDDGDSDVNPANGRTATLDATTVFTHYTVDAGYARPATVGNFAWQDLDRDGQQDSGEQGLANISVNIYADANGNGVPDGPVLATTATNSAGAYSIGGLFPGKYILEFLSSAGYAPTLQDQGPDATDSDVATNGRTATFTLLSNQNEQTVDAGFATSATIGNFVWDDLDFDGIQEAGEPGLSGVSVLLFPDADANGQPDGTAVGSTTTDVNGYYQIANVAPGNYVLEYNKSGYSGTKRLNTTNKDEGDSDMIAYTRRTATIPVAAGETDNSNDAGFYRPGYIGNFVWRDQDGDGQQDANEPGIAAVTVHLYADQNSDGVPDGAALQSMTTSNSGGYVFFAEPGKYLIGFVLPPGYIPSPHNQGPDATDSDAHPTTGRTGTIIVTSGLFEYSVDAGFVPAAKIGGLMWDDSDADGIFDVSEPRLIGNVTLYEDANADWVPDGPAIDATVTDGLGQYVFNGLGPNYYLLAFNGPSEDWISTKRLNTNNKDFWDSDINNSKKIGAIPLLVGETDLSNCGGFAHLGLISGIIWQDMDGNGIMNGGENVFNGITVKLWKDTNNDNLPDQVSQTQIAHTGTYSFGQLLLNKYWVQFVKPVGNWTWTLQNQGSDDLDSDASPSNGFTDMFPIQSGLHEIQVFAGFRPTSSKPNEQEQDKKSTQANASTQQDEGISIYPNPAERHFTVDIPLEWGQCQVEIFDVQAKRVYLAEAAQQIVVQTKDWAAGLYMVRVQSQQNAPHKEASERIVIRKR